MTDLTHSDHHSYDIDFYEAMWEVLWTAFPLFAVVAFVFWLIIS